jgi:hypothetical protein
MSKGSRKIKASFASEYNPMTMEWTTDVDEIAKALSKSYGDIPKYINDTRAMEIHLLAKAYLKLRKAKA